MSASRPYSPPGTVICWIASPASPSLPAAAALLPPRRDAGFSSAWIVAVACGDAVQLRDTAPVVRSVSLEQLLVGGDHVRGDLAVVRGHHRGRSHNAVNSSLPASAATCWSAAWSCVACTVEHAGNGLEVGTMNTRENE